MNMGQLDNKSDGVQGAGDRIVRLWERIMQLLSVSQDPAFTEYLKLMLYRTRDVEERAVYLQADLEKQYQLYQRNMKVRQASMAARPFPKNGNPTPMPLNGQQSTIERSSTMVQQPETMAQQPNNMAQQPENMAQQSNLVVSQPDIAGQQPSNTAPQSPMEHSADTTWQPAGVGPQPTAERPVRQKSEGDRKNAEFTIGAAVLGIVGSTFILTAMVLLGLYFLEGLMKGMLLYAASVLVMVLSEKFLYKKWPRLGSLFSAIGMAGLYVSTMVNYLALGNFNAWVTVGMTVGITIFILFLSRKRDALFYRILGMVAMYCCFYLALQKQNAAQSLGAVELVTSTGMIFIINIMCIVMPLKKAKTVMDIVHLSLNTFFTLWFYFDMFDTKAAAAAYFSGNWHYLLFVAVSLLVMQIIFMEQVRYQVKKHQAEAVVDGLDLPVSVPLRRNLGICIAYGVSALWYAALAAYIANYQTVLFEGGKVGFYRLLCFGIVAALGMLPLVFIRDRREKWFSWYLINLTGLGICFELTDRSEICLYLLALLAASKLISFTKAFMPRISDAIVTTVACIAVAAFWQSKGAIPLFVGIVLSILCINYWKVYFEVILAYAIAWYTSAHMLQMLKLPVFVGILLVGMLIFNNVRRWHGEGMVIFHGFALIGQALCYLLLFNPIYRNAYLTYLCMLIFGITVFYVCFQSQYHLDFYGKQWVLAIFLTYMALVIRTDYSIINSILLMLTALVCVGMGFSVRMKPIRIYGLVLSLAVCGKLVLYDFAGGNILQKTVLFFAVGMIALIISSIYMILEKNFEKALEEDRIYE